MAKKRMRREEYAENTYGRSMEREHSFIPHGHNDHACMPQEVITGYYGKVNEYQNRNVKDLYDGVEESMSEQSRKLRELTNPFK